MAGGSILKMWGQRAKSRRCVMLKLRWKPHFFEDSKLFYLESPAFGMPGICFLVAAPLAHMPHRSCGPFLRSFCQVKKCKGPQHGARKVGRMKLEVRLKNSFTLKCKSFIYPH